MFKSIKFSYIPYKINKMIVLINLPKHYRNTVLIYVLIQI